jgi:hypothetical protein
MDVVNNLLAQGEKFETICFGGELKDWSYGTLLAAQCYLGMLTPIKKPKANETCQCPVKRRRNC